MGYTHYWKLTAAGDARAYADALVDIAKIVRASTVPLGDAFGDDAPELNEQWVAFNGKGGDAYETFALDTVLVSKPFEFCKTAQRPYDLIVVACLSRLAEVGEATVKVASDGGAPEWRDGAAFASTVLGRTVEIPARVRAESGLDQ